ncbi:MAG: molybdate ABC transporter substrate-binding protein [Thermoleophilia bacterium]
MAAIPTARRRTSLAVALIVGVAVLGVGLVLLVIGCGSGGDPAADGATGSGVSITVSAASDLALALDELGPLFTKETGVRVVVNLGSSGQLAQQIEQGAPVEVFFSANRGYVDELADKGLVQPGDTALYGVGRVTLWTRADRPLRIETVEDLTDPAVKRIAIANPDHAPYGRAAREALESAGLWDELQPKIVLAENVLQALQFADSGNADVAFVARSLSVQGEGRWALVPAELHKPIEQTLAVIASAPQAEWGRRFAEFVNGPEGRPVLDRYGFELPAAASASD